MTAFFIGMLAETPLHPGTGQSSGVVDLPVAREKTTGYPHQPETGLKGALKQWCEEREDDFPKADRKKLFGDQDDGAGEVLFTTGRLLLLPVRRLDGIYAWVTTPGLIERLRRDMMRILHSDSCPAIAAPEIGTIRCGFHTDGVTEFLEEFPFTTLPLQRSDPNNKDGQLIALLTKFIGQGTQPAERLGKQIAIMNDADFRWYADNALPVNARNVLDDAKISKNLWYEETLPVDTLLYAALPPRGSLTNDAANRYSALKQKLTDSPYLQIGGNETVGHGWVRAITYPT
jgi:CRISPR-associated protein Cmr4